MKLKTTLISAALLSTYLQGQAQNPSTSIATWKNNATAVYSFIHDDFGDPSVIGINNYADTIARNRNLKFTFGAITSACENNPAMWSDAIDMLNYGHEIINHTHNHTCAIGNSWCVTGLWAEGATEDFATELDLSTNLIDTRTGTYPRYFIYPFDLFNNAANNHLKTLDYIGSRTGNYNAADDPNFTPDADGFFRSALVVDVSSGGGAIPLSNLNYWADYAISNGVWVNREMHNVGATGWGSIQVSDYRAHLNYLKEKVDANDLWVGTVSEILTYQIQKLNYTPTTIYNQVTQEIVITWNSPSFNVADYLAPLAKKSPVTLMVDMDGIDPAGLKVFQGTNEITEVTIVNGQMQFDAYPHNGKITISPKGCVDFCLITPLKDETKNKGGNVNFGIYVTSSLPLTYTWYKDNVVIPGQSTSTLSYTDLQIADGGTYKVVVSNGTDIIESSAILVVENQQAYNGVIAQIPGFVQFEEFDSGGQGVSYNESSLLNQGGSSFRNEPVDIESTTGGGYNVGYVTSGEWLEYTINVTQPGIYTVKVKHASATTDGLI